ncbi:MAG: iron ABC transporter permease [Candidatus Methanofastidiosa archaeon]|nr:iron ABC transporter permease [Candidatus Methanofastidiosa archaeon]
MIKTRHLFSNISLVSLLIALPISLFFLSFLFGRYPVPIQIVIKVFMSKIIPIETVWSSNLETVIFKIRLPRIIACMLVGAGLSISGASLQGLFRNPLVAPDILGVSSGAGFGAALGILLSFSSFQIQLFAFLFGILAVSLAYGISKVYSGTNTMLILILAGIVVSALFQSLISLTKYVADPFEKLPAITFWLMGSFASVSVDELMIEGPLIVICTLILILIRWRINILSLGEEEAEALGVNTKAFTIVITILVTLITASSVCISGIIGWVGLVIPHIGRMIIGPDYKKLLPVTLSIGATYLVLIDNITRTVTSGEIPIGILTAVVGAPFFIWLILKSKVVAWA